MHSVLHEDMFPVDEGNVLAGMESIVLAEEEMSDSHRSTHDMQSTRFISGLQIIVKPSTKFHLMVTNHLLNALDLLALSTRRRDYTPGRLLP